MLRIALDISESFQPTGGSGQQALFTPGEAVDAIVLKVLDPSRLVILVKGITLNARSLTGPLDPGQIIHARVEWTDGQILLKLVPPRSTQALQQPTQLYGERILAVTRTDTRDPDPIPQLLRTLLPADESFGSSFERLLSSVRSAVQGGGLPEQAGNDLERLHERLIVKGNEPSGPQVKAAVLAKGLQYEHSLLPLLEKSEAGGKEAIEPTLKGWLLATLTTHGKPVPASQGGGTPMEETLPPGLSQGSAQESLND